MTRRLLVVGLFVLGMGASRARALATSDGTLITNVATATFGSMATLPTVGWGGVNFEVSYAATQTVLVATPTIALQKTSQPSIECSGGTITFCIWAVNLSTQTSAFNVYVQDRYPPLVGYVVGQQTWALGTVGGTIFTNWGNGPAQRFPGEPPAGMDAASAAGYYLRWTINTIGPGKSALMCYKAALL
jgi:hypothetical protein